MVSLSAIDASDPGTNDIEPFSSCGPTNDGRLKPEAAAIDGVSVTGSGGFSNPFYGTSAAAPHAAAIAALLLDCNPGLTRDGLRNALLNKAVDLGAPGDDYDFGHGRLDAYQSALSAGCSAGATPTPTLPAVPTATPTLPVGTAVPTGTPSGTQYGNVNCVGGVNSIDAALVLQYGASLIASLACQAAADVNGDGHINSIDAALILQFISGLLSHLPA